MSNPVTTHRSISDLLTRLRDEADLCRSETAADIAALLDEAAGALEDMQRDADTAVTDRNDELLALRQSLTAREQQAAIYKAALIRIGETICTGQEAGRVARNALAKGETK